MLLCDADGTLLDSRDWWEDAFCFTLKRFGIKVPPLENIYKTFAGVPITDIYRKIASYVDADECTRVHMGRQAETLDMIKRFPCVQGTLARLSEKNVGLAVVTSRKFHEPISTTLKDLGIFDFFQTIICMEDVENPKPDPEGVLLAMKRLGFTDVDKERVYIVGDTILDMQAGKRAGVKTIGALYGLFHNRAEARRIMFREKADYYAHNTFSQVHDIVLA